MAGFNEILAARFPRSLQKLFGMKGAVPTPALSSDIFAVHKFASGVENLIYEGWDTFAVQTVGPAQGVGNFTQYRFRNPVGSNVIAVFTAITTTSGTQAAPVADSVLLTQGPTTAGADLANAVTMSNARLDARGRPTPTLILTFGIDVVFGSNRLAIAVPVNVSTTFLWHQGMEIPLLPGDGLALRFVGNSNIQTAIAAMWRERALEESELKG